MLYEQTKVEEEAAREEDGDAVRFARERLGFEPDEAQAEVLRSEARRGILNCSRQWGKSTVIAAKALHYAWTHAEALVVAGSPSGRQSREFLRKVKGFARRLGLKPRGDGDNAISLLLPNGARIVGLPGREDTVRGFSAAGLLLIDEAARVEDGLFHSLKPMLAVSNGALWLMSTPFGQQGFFWEAWERGKGWEKLAVPAERCPRLSKDFLAMEKESMPERLYRQEYGCEFTEIEGQWMSRETAEGILSEEVKPLWR